MDAICFVLGVQTASMRSAQLRDLVYREEGESGSSNIPCSVSMVLRDPASDGELIFKRSIVIKGGSASSDFRVDGKKVSAEDYDERLSALNILARAKNFLVFQGDVASIGGGGSSSQTLTKLFEQVSGSAALEERYEELRAAKERAEETTVMNFQKKRGMDAEKKQFKEQESEAQHYRDLLKRQADLKQEQMVFELLFCNNQLESLKQQVDEAKSQSAEAESALASAEISVSAAQKELGKAKRVRLQQDNTFSAKLKDHMKINPEVISLRKEAEHLSKKIQINREKDEALQREITDQDEELKSLEQQLFDIQRIGKDFEAEVERQGRTDQIALDEEQLERYNMLKEEATRASLQDRNRVSDLRNQLLLKEEELASLVSKQDGLTRQRADLEQDLKSLQNRLAQQQAAAEENNSKIEQVQGEIARKESRRKEIEKLRDKRTHDLALVQEQLREEKMDRKQSERETRFLQTLEALKRIHPGVRGRLCDLAEPRQNKYQLAAAVAMGRHMDSIVVDDRATAVDCLQYMKSQKAGVATFLPLDSIHPKPVNERLRNLGGSAKLVIDVLNFDPAVEKALLYALGSTLVCDNEQEAKSLAFGREKQKTVTLAGTVIHKSGVMAGGAHSAAQGAKKWTNQKLEGLKKSRDEHLEQLERLALELRSLNASDEDSVTLSSLNARRQGLDLDIQQCKTKIAGIESEIRAVDKELKSMQPGLKAVQSDIDGRKKEIASAEKAVNQAEDKIFIQFCRSVGVANIREYEQEAVNKAKARNDRRAQLAAQESRISAAISYAKSRNLEAPRKEVLKQVKADSKHLEDVQKKLQTLAKQEEGLLKELEAMKRESKTLKDAEQAAQEHVKNVRKAQADKSTLAAQLEKTAADLEGKMRVLQSRRHAVLRRATVDEINLPYVGDEGFREPSNTQSQLEVFEQENEIEFDFAVLREELQNVSSEEEFARVNANILAELQAVGLELGRMNPNLKAVDKLQEVQQKAKEMEDELKEARREGQTVAQAFQEIREERLNLFLSCFKHVQDKIEGIYDLLTRNERKSIGGLPTPGGKAFLTLQDPHEPWRSGITYQTIPPAKRLWNFDQLSGGEKSLASLALIFAVQSFRPSPFFVLDEIDAALDSHNVEKVVRFISNSSRECQFIVISLKDSFFSQADALVGVYKDNLGECSRTMSIDLAGRQYAQ